MISRILLLALASMVGLHVVQAHTPYGQWVVYRKKHLLIGSHRADPETYSQAKRLAGILARELPKSKCRVARAPTAGRLASLLGTGQLDVAVLRQADAEGMLGGKGLFEPYGPIALRKLVHLGPFVLVAHERFPDRHAVLVAETLRHSLKIDHKSQASPSKIQWHDGLPRQSVN